MLISIFCTVIDNLGDIGVCWRLAKNLAKYNKVKVNLYVDCLLSFSKIADIDIYKKIQSLNKVNVLYWENNLISYDRACCVINAFACKLPPEYQQGMPLDIIWLQLDYLATENWADEFNGLSAVINKHTRYFITPGFTHKTSGLLTSDFSQLNTLQKQQYKYNINEEFFNIFIFAYINQNMLDALKCLIQISKINDKKIKIYMPTSVYKNLVEKYSAYYIEMYLSQIICLDFCKQEEFDSLLQCFDFLWLRGEDSFIRGQLSQVPMIWQAYIQNDNAHFNKVQEFLEKYVVYFNCINQQQAIKNLWQAINGIKKININIWQEYFKYINDKDFYQSLSNWQQYLYSLPKLEQTILNYTNR